jgi:hypothetical protein
MGQTVHFGAMLLADTRKPVQILIAMVESIPGACSSSLHHPVLPEVLADGLARAIV